MQVIGYGFDADIHCVDCTKTRRFLQRIDLPMADGEDEHGLPYAAIDSEGNYLSPVFDIQENSENETCGDCGEALLQ